MAYNKFKRITQLREVLGISDFSENWLPRLTDIPVSSALLQDLTEAQGEALGTEKAKSEYVITPILKELKRQNPNKFSTFSGYQFDVEPQLSLTGFCDFILSANPRKLEIEAPIFCLVEAKNDNIEHGIAQCGAEMYAAFLYNERHEILSKTIYGCVTTAFLWCFLKLEHKTLSIDPNYVPLTFENPHRVMAVLQWIVEESGLNQTAS